MAILTKRSDAIAVFCLLMLSVSGALRADQVDDYLLAKMTEKKIPGLQVAVVSGDEIIKLASYGIANIQDSVAVTDDTVFTINSMTKGFAGVAVMQLVEQGRLELAAEISNYLTDLPGQWQAVTVEQLLTHTSGLPDIMGDGVYQISTRDADRSWEKVKQQPLEFEAGTQFRYNQTNYLLLGKIIDQLGGMPFTRFIQHNQLQKAGMARTEAAGFAHFQDVIPHQARGYTHDQSGNLTATHAEFPPFLRAAAGMSSNAKELASWLIALQNGQLLVDPSSIEVLWTPAVLANGKTGGFSRLLNGYALGWQTIGRQDYPAVASVGGNRAALMVYPENDLGIVVITNLMGASPEDFIDEIAGLFLPGMQSVNGMTIPAKILEEYVGEYAFPDFSVAVSLQGKALSILASGPGQESFPVFAESEAGFFAKVVDAEFSFQRNRMGEVEVLTMRQGGREQQATRIK